MRALSLSGRTLIRRVAATGNRLITLYELHWSHYCEKVRLALNYMGLPWRAVGISPFSKRELRAHPLPAQLPNYTVPAIQDGAHFVIDSTPILRHLASAYPEAPPLFPGDADARAEIDALLLDFDTLLGIPARRLGYTQLILECPDLLADLFLDRSRVWRLPLLRQIAGRALGVVLTQRFEFHRNESLGLYEALEAYALQLAERLHGREFLVGTQLSAADLALAAQLRPLGIVPFFAEHPGLQALFAWQRALLARWSGEGASAYEAAIEEARRKRAPMRRHLRARCAALPFARDSQYAGNDQRPVWTWALLLGPWRAWRGLRHNKRRALLASATLR